MLCVSLSIAAGVTTSHEYVWLQRNKVSVPHPLSIHSSDSTPSSSQSPVRSFSPTFIKNSTSFVKEEEETPTPSPARSSPTVSRETSTEAPSIVPSTSSSSTTLAVPVHQQLQMPTIQALAVLSNVSIISCTCSLVLLVQGVVTICGLCVQWQRTRQNYCITVCHTISCLASSI